MQSIWGYRNVVGKLWARLAPEINLYIQIVTIQCVKYYLANSRWNFPSGFYEDWNSDQKSYPYLKASFYTMALSGSFFQEQWKKRHSPARSAATKLSCPSKWSVQYTVSKTDIHMLWGFFKTFVWCIVQITSSLMIKHYVYVYICLWNCKLLSLPPETCS